MSASDYLLGAVSVLVYTVAVVWAARRLARRLLPAWTGSPAVAAVLVLTIVLVIVIGEVLGTIGWLSRGPLVLAAVLVAAACWRSSSAIPSTETGETHTTARAPTVDRLRELNGWQLAAAAAVVIVVGQSLWGVWRTIHYGVYSTDALQYHYTDAALFARDHATRHIHLDNPNSTTPWYPLNTELITATGMALFGRDSLTLLLGFLDIAGVLVVVRALSRRWGTTVSALSTIGACFLLLTLGATYETLGDSDWRATWLLLAGVLFLAEQADAGPDLAAAAIGGLALGAACGAKLTVLLPAAVLFIAAVALTRDGRARAGGIWLLAALLAGAYWYARDLFIVGSPLPEVHIPGLPQPPLGLLSQLSTDVAHYLGNWTVIRTYLVPGVHNFFGPCWPVLLIALVVGLVGGLLHRDRRRLLAIIGLVTLVTYLFTPTTAGGLPGQPVLFYFNIRYGMVAFVAAMVLLPSLLDRAWWRWLVAAADAALIVGFLSTSLAWADLQRARGLLWSLGLLAVVAVGAAIWRLLPWRPPPAASLAGLAVVAIAAIWPANSYYLSNRYLTGYSGPERIYQAMADVSHSRIGIQGQQPAYPLLGPTWTNVVGYVGQAERHGLLNVTSCRAWRAALNRGHFRYVVVGKYPLQARTPQWLWTASDPVAHRLIAVNTGAAWRLDGLSPMRGCSNERPTNGNR